VGDENRTDGGHLGVMRTSLVLTVIGNDRPGIVEQISDQVLAAGANWEESRMARLAGKFTGLLRVSVDGERAEALADSLRTLSSGGLTVVVERGAGDDVGATRGITLDLVGNDHAGIVRDIARALADRHINIEELETEVTSAAMSGETLFRAHAHLAVPATVTLAELRTLLEAVGSDLMVDITLEEQ
jgi:glycine cleavage system regulatory protein